MKSKVDFIEHQECPIVDGIIFPDSTILLLDVTAAWKPTVKFKIQTASKTSIADLDRTGKLFWAGCSILDEYDDVQRSIKIVCGEGSYGSDGFLAVINWKTKSTIWMAYFTSSNPFCKVKTEDNQLVAISTIGCAWRFELENPTEVEVICHE